MVEIPDSLVERLKERQVVLVAGLGCSELAGAAGWNELTEALSARLVFSDARQVVARLTTSGRMTDAIAFMRNLVPHQLVEETLAQAYPQGAAVPDAMSACVRFPWRAVVTTGFDDLWERALEAADGGRRPPTVLTAGEDPRRRSRPGRLFCTSRAASRCPRVCASARATRASGWCRRRGWPGWRTCRAGARWCSSASAPRIPTWSGFHPGWRRARARRRTSCSWTCRRILTRTPRSRCGRCAPASR